MTSEINDLVEAANYLIQEQKLMINWAHGLEFMKVKTDPDESIVSLVKSFSDTDSVARLVWDTRFRVLYANDSFLESLGYTLDELVGQKIIEKDGSSRFIHESTLKATLEIVQKNMAKGVVMSDGVNNEWVAKDGSRVPIKWLIGFNDTNNKVGSAQCLFLTKD